MTFCRFGQDLCGSLGFMTGNTGLGRGALMPGLLRVGRKLWQIAALVFHWPDCQLWVLVVPGIGHVLQSGGKPVHASSLGCSDYMQVYDIYYI